MPFVHDVTAMPLDIVLAGSGLEDEFLDRARVTAIGAITVPSDRSQRSHYRQGAGRAPQDLDDASGLWRIHRGQFDEVRIRRMLRLLEEALSQSDFVSTFEGTTR